MASGNDCSGRSSTGRRLHLTANKVYKFCSKNISTCSSYFIEQFTMGSFLNALLLDFQISSKNDEAILHPKSDSDT